MATIHLDDALEKQSTPEVAPMRSFDPAIGPELPMELLVAVEERQTTTSASKPHRRPQWLHPAIMLRVLAACSAVMLGAWYLSERLLLVSSLEGVVTAPLVVLRSPINGKVRIEEAIEPAIGVRAGQALFTLIDDQVDERVLADLQARLSTMDEAEQTVLKRVADLEDLRATLQERSRLHRNATIKRLEAMINEAKAAREGARAQLTLSQAELTRVRALTAHGVQSATQQDGAEAGARRAFFEVERLSAVIERIRAELEATRNGMMIGDGYSDVPYSLQRMDELSIRISELSAERNTLDRTRRELIARLASEKEHLDLLRTETVHSPANGLIWSLGVADGARVSRGDILGEFTDCRYSYVEATLPERGFDTVHPGALVRVRLSSDTHELPGIVRSLRGSGATGTTARAASIERVGTGLMTVVVEINPEAMTAHPAGACQIGRSAKVLF
jgi:multidrug resistance efflux pump